MLKNKKIHQKFGRFFFKALKAGFARTYTKKEDFSALFFVGF